MSVPQFLRVLFAAALLAGSYSFAQTGGSSPGVGVPTDWSTRHLVINNSAAVGTQVFVRDPRVLSNLAVHRQRPKAGANVASAPRRPKPKKNANLLTDWSASLSAGRMAPGMSPAKFSFYTDTTPSCTTDFVVYTLDVPGISGFGTATITTISLVSGVATVTTSAAHGFFVGAKVTIVGSGSQGFNGIWTITSVPTATTFTFSQAGLNTSAAGGVASINQANLVAFNNLYSGSTPAGNAGLCGSGSGTIAASGAVRSSNTVTITTTAAHNFVAGNGVTITGAGNNSFNGTFKILTVPTSTKFTFSQTGPNQTASGGNARVAPTPYWAYATTSATCGGNPCPGSGNFTSPSLAFDSTGSKVAFVESVSDATATCPGRAGTGACSIFHVLTWTADQGSVLAPVGPGSMVSITYASATNTSSSPWIDYTNDAAYVGADDGKLYRFTGVFAGTPILDTNFGDVVGTPGVTITANQKLSPPVHLVGVGLDSGFIFVGDALGNLKALQVSTKTLVGSGILVGGGAVNPIALEPVLVYYDSVNDPNYISVFAVSASTAGFGSAFPSGAPAISPNRGVVIQALLDLTGPTFTAVSGLDTGKGANGGNFITYRSGAFTNAFYTSPTTGFLYVCGTGSAQPRPHLYAIGFNTPLASPRNLVPTLDSAAVSQTGDIVASNNDCSPLTEFPNPNLTVTDTLFFGILANTATIYNWNISGALQAAPIGTAPAPGGSSGIVIDNTQAFSGSGTSQGSSIYFSTQVTSNTQCGTGTYCAMKLRQADLQ